MAMLTVREVAERLRLHEMTVRRHIREGRLRALRVGGRIRVQEEELMRLSSERRYDEPTPEQLRARLLAPLSEEEAARRRKVGEEMRRLRAASKPLGFSTATLVRVARRADEVLYGDKTWEELIAEES